MERIIKVGIIESIEDHYGAMRVWFKWEGNQLANSSHYAFPLMPKTFQSMPKIGEKSLIIQESDGGSTNHYYLGPLIPQPQLMYKANSEEVDSRVCKNEKNHNEDGMQLVNPETYPLYKGAFPNPYDVAVVGRKSEDIILKDDEIDIRCGIRQQPINIDEADLKGYISFNSQDPSYIQLKYGHGLSNNIGQEANSMINLVADKINIMSHKDKNLGSLAKDGELVGNSDEDYDTLMKNLHKVPYGDELANFLDKMRRAIDEHVHAFNGLPPVKCPNMTAMDGYDLSNTMSDHVRIS